MSVSYYAYFRAQKKQQELARTNPAAANNGHPPSAPAVLRYSSSDHVPNEHPSAFRGFSSNNAPPSGHNNANGPSSASFSSSTYRPAVPSTSSANPSFYSAGVGALPIHGEDQGANARHRHASSEHAALNRGMFDLQTHDDVFTYVQEHLNELDTLNLLTAMNRLSRIGNVAQCRRDPRMRSLINELHSMLRDDKTVPPQHISSACNALARLKIHIAKDPCAQRLLRLLSQLVILGCSEFRARDLSNVAWAFATLGEVDNALLLTVAAEVTRKICEFNEQNLSNTIWAFAKLRLRHDPMVVAIAEETMKKIANFTPQGLSNIAWAFATQILINESKLGMTSHKLFMIIADECMKRLDGFTPQEIQNTAWAFARLGIKHEQFIRAMCDYGATIVNQFSPQDMSNMALSTAKMNMRHDTLYDAIERYSMTHLDKFEARELSNLSWAFSIVSYDMDRWCSAVVPTFIQLVRPQTEGWELVQFVNACWIARKNVTEWSDLQLLFGQRVFTPVVSALRDVMNGVFDAHQRMQRLIKGLEVDFLGPRYTRAALTILGLSSIASDAFKEDVDPLSIILHWGADARAHVLRDLNVLKTNLSDTAAVFDRFGPHERRVLAWMAYDITVFGTRIVENGRIAHWDFDEHRPERSRQNNIIEAMSGHHPITKTDVRAAQEWLRPLFAQHDRVGHAERQASVEIALNIAECIIETRRWPKVGYYTPTEVHGSVRLFVCHFFCISCMGVMSQFRHRFPGIELDLDYDDCWRTRLLDV
eukprot:GEMP01012975.1.p1 GENE.GEMP01012975.1~~GEMP01012975.1.p1  ORF type:complete len:763 (+),score=211.79 GEMP01012975.1:35-2323(+)